MMGELLLFLFGFFVAHDILLYEQYKKKWYLIVTADWIHSHIIQTDVRNPAGGHKEEKHQHRDGESVRRTLLC